MIIIAGKHNQPEIKLAASKSDRDLYFVGILKTAQIPGKEIALVEIIKDK